MPKQKSVVGHGDLTKLPLIYWSLLLIIASLFTSTTAQSEITSVSLVEPGAGVVRINTNIEFTCTFVPRSSATIISAVNLEYGPTNIVCMSWASGDVIVKKNHCASPKGSTVQKISDSTFRFALSDAQLTDQLSFTCRVYGSFSDQAPSSPVKIVVEVPPEEPVITFSNSGDLILGEPLDIKCVANTGKPEGTIVWYRTASTQGAQEEEINAETSTKQTFPNGTVEVTETLPRIVTLAISDNGVKYRCAGSNSAIKQNEALPSAEKTLNVLYGVTAIIITPTQVAGKTAEDVPYFYPGVSAKVTCSGNGNPAPTIVWTKVTGDNDLQTLADTLFIGENAPLGDYSYKCSAQNSVAGSSTEVVEEYKFAVQAKPTEAPRPTEPVTTKPTVPGDTGESTGALNTAGLAGGLAGAVIAILIIVAIVFCVCRRKKKGMLDEDAEQGKQSKTQGFDNGPAGGFDVELDDNQPYNNYPKTNGGAFPIDTVDNTPGSRRGFHVPADPNYDPAYM